jgi:hypothetical protein
MSGWLFTLTRGCATWAIINVCNGLRERRIGFMNEMMKRNWYEDKFIDSYEFFIPDCSL